MRIYSHINVYRYRLHRSGNQVRINVQLIDAVTDEHLWAEIYDRELTAENLNAEVFTCLTEARVLIEKWRCRYNERRPHSSQNYITPAMAYFGLREMRKI